MSSLVFGSEPQIIILQKMNRRVHLNNKFPRKIHIIDSNGGVAKRLLLFILQNWYNYQSIL